MSRISKIVRTTAWAVLLVLCSQGLAPGQLLPRCYRGTACERSGIPAGQYQVTVDSPTVSALSLRATVAEPTNLLEPIANLNAQDASAEAGNPTPAQGSENAQQNNDVLVESTRGASRIRTKSFQFDKSLVIHHCKLSAMAATINSDGQWTVSLVAEQNGDNTTFNRLTRWLKQNEFVVTFKFYTDFQVDPIVTDESLATFLLTRPVVAQVGPIEFYVRKGQPYHLLLSGPKTESGLSRRNAVSSTRLQPRVSNRGAHQQLARHFDQVDRVSVSFNYRGGEVVQPTIGRSIGIR